ncbi:hypothetical protein EON63_00125 [archaeon]|nr:MAG: hypothetical protein EON63_00125 [archaeon]
MLGGCSVTYTLCHLPTITIPLSYPYACTQSPSQPSSKLVVMFMGMVMLMQTALIETAQALSLAPVARLSTLAAH